MRNFLLIVFSIVIVGVMQAQVKPAHPTDIVKGTYHGLSKPLRNLPAMTAEEFHQMELKGLKRTLNKGLQSRSYPFAETALPKGPDPFRQDHQGTTYGNRSPIKNFDGQTSPYYPPDCNGTIGPNHFMQTINTVYAIYDKSGAIVAGPTDLNLLFGSVPGANRNDGDPIILYDEQADRWVVTEFSIPFSGPNYILFAVSATNDPTGTWHQYSFQVASMPDYPKFSVWQDGYYMGDNNSGGNDTYVFERAKMLIGQPAQAVGFNNQWRPTSIDDFMCVPPIDNDGTFAPAGSPGMFIAFNDDAVGGGSDQIWLYELTVNWATPASSALNRIQQIDVQPFSANFGNNWNNIDQKGVSQRVDGVPQVFMNVPQYRNFGDHQTIVCCHTVNLDGAHHAGIRWYELRKSTGSWVVRQQGTYAPDANSRWMGSIAMNANHEIGLGYNVSSTTVYPGILFCGQSAGENANATGILDFTEDTIWVGTNSQTGANRWGDYAQISVDPTDNATFWFTTQYIGSGGSRKTRIASFKFTVAPVATTLPATAVTYVGATLNGNVNPNGAATEVHFEYGLTPINMTNSTPVVSIGSGTNLVPVTADITGLSPQTVYYYKVVATSGGGTTSGLKVKFTTEAAPFLSVAPPNQNVISSAGQTEFQVSANVTWAVVTDAAWCTVPASGTGSDTLVAVFTDNPVASTRIANVTVSGSGVPQQTVTVTQEGAAPLLSVTPPNQNVQATGGATQFEVISNTTWSVASDVAWCTLSGGGSLNGTIIATCEPNSSVTGRTCSINVSAPGLAAVTVTVTQAGVPAILSVTPPNQNVAAVAGNTTFQVTSNTNWTVQSDAAWCAVTQSGSGNGSIVANYLQNGGDQARVANISVVVAGLPVQTVTVSQAKSSIGIDENNSGNIRIYPNPTTGIFKIVSANGNTGTINLQVTDLAGKIIMEKSLSGATEYRIDMSGAAQGTYHLNLKSNESVSVTKLVVIK